MTRKLLSILLALIPAFTLTIPAMAASVDTASTSAVVEQSGELTLSSSATAPIVVKKSATQTATATSPFATRRGSNARWLVLMFPIPLTKLPPMLTVTEI